MPTEFDDVFGSFVGAESFVEAIPEGNSSDELSVIFGEATTALGNADKKRFFAQHIHISIL